MKFLADLVLRFAPSGKVNPSGGGGGGGMVMKPKKILLYVFVRSFGLDYIQLPEELAQGQAVCYEKRTSDGRLPSN